MRVAVIGAGYSGTMAAVALARLGKSEILLVERRTSFAAGAAYSTRDPSHLLNVRAHNMSAFPDEPDHFAAWAEREGLGGPDDFMRRMDYRRYLAALLDEAARGGRIRLVQDEALALDSDGDGALLALASGDRIPIDSAIMAGGNYPSALLGRFGLPSELSIDDPWSVDGQPAIGRLAGRNEDVLIVGTGLTMVDICLSLDESGYRGRILATSRRGLVPRAQDRAGAAPLPPPPDAGLGALMRTIRRKGNREGWRAAVDSLRPRTIEMWRGFSDAEQRRFLRHLRPWWDVHRHRIAPKVADRLDDLSQQGRLETLAGRIAGLEDSGGLVEARIAPRGGGPVLRRRFAAVINCTGPEGEIRRVSDPLIRHMLANGTARPDGLGMGLDVDEQSRLIRADGSTSPNFYALGPLTRGAFWEIVAVPDIRSQASEVATAISG